MPTDDAIGVSQSSPENWLCQTSPSGGWACRRDADPTADPRPTRLPVVGTESPAPPAPPPATEPTLNATRVPTTPVVAPATEPAPPVSPTVSTPAPATVAAPPPAEDTAVPLYRRLAYQSDRELQLMKLPAGFYALQLLAMSSREELAQLVNERRLQGTITALVERNGRFFYVLLAGIYENSETAERAAISLEAEFDDFKPWVRPLRTLQNAMRRADRIAGG